MVFYHPVSDWLFGLAIWDATASLATMYESVPDYNTFLNQSRYRGTGKV